MKKGFTFIEFAIILAILGILAAILVPALARAKALAERNHAEALAKEKKNKPVFSSGDIVYLRMNNKKAMVLETRFDEKKCAVVYVVRVDGVEASLERMEVELSAEAEKSFNY
jgi:Tfp pilus assembly protein PilE